MTSNRQSYMPRASHLDGLRGCAALVVLFGHLMMMVWPATTVMEIPLGNTPAWQITLAASPVSVIWDGRLAVSVFFVLSGYVLTAASTARPLSFPALVGKRYVRLLLPVLAAMIPTLVLLPRGWYFNHELAYVTGSGFLNGFTSTGFRPSILGWLRTALWVVFFEDGHTSYDVVLWTMRFEWYGSLIVFFLVCLLRRPAWRLPAAALLAAVIGVLPAYAILHLFLVGMILFDLTTLLQHRASRWQPQPVILNVLGLALTAFGLYLPRLLMVVIDGRGAAFAVVWWLRRMLPSWQGDRWMIGAIAIVAGILISPMLRHVLAGPLCQFLGRISFPLYLFHMPILLSLGSWLILILLPYLDLPGAALCTFLIVTCVALPVAWLMSLLVEQPALRASAWTGSMIEALWLRLRPWKVPAPEAVA